MLDSSAREGVKCDPKSDERHKPICGSDLAFPYFISFYVLCSFLVSEPALYCKDIHKILVGFFTNYVSILMVGCETVPLVMQHPVVPWMIDEY
jgi:Ni,Fe-hydrogenase I cytochrome b subunit